MIRNLIFNSELKPLYIAFLHSIKLSGYKMGINFDKDPFVVEQINYLTKIENVYIVYDLNARPKNLHRNFTIKNCFFGPTSSVKNSDKEKYVYSGYAIAFNGNLKWSFDNGTAINNRIFAVDNSSSSHANNSKDNFVVLGEGDTFGIYGSFGAPEKRLVLILVKQTESFA